MFAQDERENTMSDYASRQSRSGSNAEPTSATAGLEPGKRSLTEGLTPVQRKASSGASGPGSAPTPVTQLFDAIQRIADAGAEGGDDAGGVHASAARGVATPSSSLPHAAAIQASFGRHDISGIQAHSGAEAAASAKEMGAEAYATGDHVVLGGGSDLHTVAHEAAHVVQQRAGVQLKGGVGVAGDRYEQHADAVADRVVQGKSAEGLLDEMAGGKTGGAPSGGGIQRKPADWNGADINGILALPTGWFSTSWGPLKTKITEYRTLLPANVAGRRTKLTEMVQLIGQWKQDPKHASNSTDQRVQNIRAQLPALEERVREEMDEMNAEGVEAQVGGHSLVRHGPDLTDAQLQNRITTGLDRTGQPAATDTSSKFASYQVWMQTRTAAVNQIDAAVGATRALVNPLVATLQANWHTFLTTPAGPAKGVAGQQRGAALGALQAAIAGIAMPNANLLRVNLPVPMPPLGAVNLGNLAAFIANLVTMRPRYVVTINHGHDVGPSFVGTGPAGGPHPGTAPGAMQTSSTTVLDTPPAPLTLAAAPAAATWPMVTHFPSSDPPGITW